MAVFTNYTPSTPQFLYKTRLYRSKVANGPNNALEDVIRVIDKVDEATGNVVNSHWFNITTGASITPVPYNEMHAYDGHRIPLKAENLKYSDSTVGLLAAIPKEANHAEIHVYQEEGPAYHSVVTLDGSVPDEAIQNGFRQSDGATYELESRGELENMQILSSFKTAFVHVQYFYQEKRNA